MHLHSMGFVLLGLISPRKLLTREVWGGLVSWNDRHFFHPTKASDTSRVPTQSLEPEKVV